MNIGVIVGLSGVEPPSYQSVKERVLAAESVGLDSVWVYDHLIFRFPEKEEEGILEAWTTWSALAEATSTITLGALVLCVPFRNPAVLAKMAVTLDEISNGRIILGIGAGWHEPEFDAFGVPFDSLVERFDEACQIIVPLLRTGSVDFRGKHYAATHCALIPPPSRQIPILIACKRPKMVRLTARYADSWNTAWHGDVSDAETNRSALAAAVEAEGRDPNSIETTAGITVAFPHLGAEVAADANPAKLIWGTVEEVATKLRAYRESGVGHVIVSLDPDSPEGYAALADAARIAK